MTNHPADKEMLTEQVARYAHLFDARDVEGWADLFTDDGVFEVRLHGSDEAYIRLQGGDELRAFASSAPLVVHHISSVVFDELSEESARTRAVVLGTWSSPEDGNPAVFTHGTYDQRWSKVDGTWRLAHLLFRSHGYSTAMETPHAEPDLAAIQ